MWQTGEIRWWWRGDAPAALEDWVLKGVAPLKDFRTDLYLADASQTDIGIKRRAGGTVEVKMLCGLPDISLPAAMDGQAELWVKADGVALPLTDENTLAVGKQRRRRILAFEDGGWREESSEDDVEAGVAVEIADIDIDGERWTTACLEAFGDDNVSGLLQAAVTLFGPWPQDMVGPDLVGGYPLWLSQRAKAGEADDV
ncbi:hypothetical protein KCG44_04770 [Pacificimonas sp. WHA3]|uniref:CYTH domain-containing protein n=1 Tax=Pacificimonas pallii TaxID=2827236 RepID=A0ABS6SCX5_9SPHN|nr:hypothetical protein [Pacificimonas pallii]MBV7256095.1 hypothetical protein [Pacificimonas pallii]